MEKKSKKITPAQIIVFAVSFAAAYFGANYLFSNDKSSNQLLLELSEETNRTLPKMIDSETRFDSVTIKGDTMRNHFTFINIPNDTIELDIEMAKSQMMHVAQMNLDTNRVMKEIRTRNITLFYNFYDRENNKVFDYTVQPKKQK